MCLQKDRWIKTLAVVPLLVFLAVSVWADPSGSSVVAQGGPPPVEGHGKVIDPTDILGKSDLYQATTREKSHGICNQRWNECAAKCDKKSTAGSRKSCLKACDRQQEKCLDTYP